MEFNSTKGYPRGSKIISKYDLEEIFLIQYNDLFSKLLKNNIEEFFLLLKKQVLFHLKIIDKQFDFSLLSFFYEKYYEICQKDKIRIQNIYNKIINYPNQNIITLNILDIYIHCYKCKDAIHKCGNQLIIYEDLFFCLKCQKVYNQHHIKLFCKECNKTYLTAIRSIEDKKHEYFYAVSYTNYHCYIENEEKIKCLNCGDNLYYNITKIKNEEQNRIRDIYCIKCKLIFDTKKIYFNCKICGENFKCEPQIFRNFSSIKKYLLLLVHTFRKGIYAIPNAVTNKKCNCDLSGALYFIHHDNGILYQGKKNGKNVIICDCCYGIFKPDNFNWNCPFCQLNFRTIKEYEIPSKNRRILRKKRKEYVPINSNISLFNNFYKPKENIYRYNDFHNSVAYPNDNLNHSNRNIIQSESFIHNRGLSLNNDDGQRRYLYLIDNNNSNLDVYKSANRILFKIGDDTRGNDFSNNYSFDKNIIKADNNRTTGSKYKNIKLKKKYLNKENFDFGSPNLNDSKKIISYLNKSENNEYNCNNNLNEINKNINNSNFIFSPISNKNIHKNEDIPKKKRIPIKGSKSVNNLKKKVKIEIPDPKNISNRGLIKTNEKKVDIKIENNPNQNHNEANKSDRNKNNLNININNASKIEQKKIKISNSNIKRINKDKKQITNKYKTTNNNNDIYQKKIMNEQKSQDKNKKVELNLNNNPFKNENNRNINTKKDIISKSVNNIVNNVKNETKNNAKPFKENENINKKKEQKNIINQNNNIIQNMNKKEIKKENINIKDNKKVKLPKNIILSKIPKTVENEKNQENSIFFRNKIKYINNNNQENKSNNIKVLEINETTGNKTMNLKENNLLRYNIINNEIISNNKKNDINNNNVVHISVNSKDKKKIKNKREKKEFKKSVEDKQINRSINRSINNKNEQEENVEKHNNNKFPLDNNSKNIKKEKIINNSNHNKILTGNLNNIRNIENELINKNNENNNENYIQNNTNIFSDKKDFNNYLEINPNQNIKNDINKVHDNNIKTLNENNQDKENNIRIRNEKENNIKIRNIQKIENNTKTGVENNQNNPIVINNNKENINNNLNCNLSYGNIYNENNVNNKIYYFTSNKILNNKKNNVSSPNNNNNDNHLGIIFNNKENITNNNNYILNMNKEKKNVNSNNLNNLCNSTNFEALINNKLNVIFNNRLNVNNSNKNLSKSINFNLFNNINNADFNSKRNIKINESNDFKDMKNNISKDSLNKTTVNKEIKINNIVNINKCLNNNINKDQKEKSNIMKKFIKRNDNNDNNISYNYNNNIENIKSIDNSCNINSIFNNENKKNINNKSKIAKKNSNSNINNLKNYSTNRGSYNENLNDSSKKKLNNIIYNNISKSTNNNLVCNIYNNSFDNNFNASKFISNSNKSGINSNNNIIPNFNKINNNKDKTPNNNKIEIKANINHSNDSHPKDSVRNNNNINNNLKNKNNNQVKDNIHIIDKKPTDNIKSHKNITAKNNTKNEEKNRKNNLKKKIKQKILNVNENNNVLKLKIYFSQMEKIKYENMKRKSSFDCRQSTNHFKILSKQEQLDIKTFDSNYYKIIRQIGKGTYGEIYLVQDPKSFALYALKKIAISDALELKDNKEEYKLTWQLTHANPELKIAKKYAIEIKKLDKYNLVMYILMEAANCDWEHELLNRQKANAFYTELELLTILKSLVNTLAILQKKGISHRDVKPQNILCFGDEGYKLTDFGEAKKNNQQMGLKNFYGFEQNTNKQTVRGTELYMSPILFRALQTKNVESAQYNAYKSDVFSLGMCFLLASSLNYHSLFEIREVFDMKIIAQVINKYLGKLYSQNYINLLISMLQVDERLRPDFIELNTAFN